MEHECYVAFSYLGRADLTSAINETIESYETAGWTLCAQSLVIAPGAVDPILDDNDALYALLTFERPRED